MIAFCIIRTESTLFDLKEGYCADAWIQPKRHCCRGVHPESCRGWITWKSQLERFTRGPAWLSEDLAVYYVVAVSGRVSRRRRLV